MIHYFKLKKKEIPMISESLLLLPLNQPVRIKSTEAKTGVVRATIKRLNEKGHQFEATERGLVDEIEVKRLK